MLESEPWPTISSSTRSFRRRAEVRPDQPARSTDRRGKPGPFTFTGTCSYIVGQGRVAIIDPGPDTPEQTRALLDAVRGETVTHILVSHTIAIIRPERGF